jgi:DNA modification methylase
VADNGQIRRVKIADLIPDRRNANLHTERGVYMVSRSLEKLGAGRSILIDKDNEIIAGNLTAEQAADMGLEEVIIVPTDGRQLVAVQRMDMDLDDPATGAREMAYADNRAAIVSIDFDPEIVSQDLEMGLDLGDWWKDAELEEMGVKEPDVPEDVPPQIDRAEELRQKWGVESGQLWQLGEHRVICGDATNKDDVTKLLDKSLIDLCVTSPPYYNQREYAQWNSFESYMLFSRDVAVSIVNNSNDYFALCWNIGDQCASKETFDIPAYHSLMFSELGLKYRDKIIWKKSGAVFDIPRSMHIENGLYFPALGHETILVYTRKHPRFNVRDKKKVRSWQINVWEIRQVMTNNPVDNEGHTAQYPVELPERCIYSYTTEEKNVFDPFLGSGTTLIACERLGRKCYGIEIDPKYVAVTLQRWADVTGRMPELVS